MKTVAKICIKHENMYTMFDGFSNIFFGQTNIPLNEGDHVLIETSPEIKIVKKLDSNQEIYKDISNRVLEINDSRQDFFSDDQFLLDKDFYS